MKTFPGKRRAAREMAVQMLYQGDVGGSDPRQIFSSFDLTRYLVEDGLEEGESPNLKKTATARRRLSQVEASFEYAKQLVQGAVEHREEIDSLIRTRADNWRLERMPIVDRNVLRLAVYEMLFQKDIPHLVVVDEAIELAKRFGSENSSRFVNGLLDGLMKKDPKAEEAT